MSTFNVMVLFLTIFCTGTVSLYLAAAPLCYLRWKRIPLGFNAWSRFPTPITGHKLLLTTSILLGIVGWFLFFTIKDPFPKDVQMFIPICLVVMLGHFFLALLFFFHYGNEIKKAEKTAVNCSFVPASVEYGKNQAEVLFFSKWVFSVGFFLLSLTSLLVPFLVY